MSSQMDDPRADEGATIDKRFGNAETTTIDPAQAVVRCLAEGGSNPMDKEMIIRTFFSAGSHRQWAEGQLDAAIDKAVKEGWIEEIVGVGWRTTESGRNVIGPMLEMELKYV